MAKMDPGDPVSSDSAYFFQDGFNWDVHTRDVLSGPALTQEEQALMTEIPLNEFDVLLNAYYQVPSSVPCEQTQCISEPEVTSQDTPAFPNAHDQVPSSVSYEQTQCGNKPEFTSNNSPAFTNGYEQIPSSVLCEQTQSGSVPEFTSQDAPTSANIFDQVLSSVSPEQTKLGNEPAFTPQDAPVVANGYVHVSSPVSYEQTYLGSEPDFTYQGAPVFTNGYDQIASSVPYEQMEWPSQYPIFQDTSLTVDANTEFSRLQDELSQLATEAPNWTSPTALSFLQNGAYPQGVPIQAAQFDHVNFNEFIEPAFLQSSPVHPPGIMLPEPVHPKSSPPQSTGNMFAQPISLQTTPVHHHTTKRLSEPIPLHWTPVRSTEPMFSDPIHPHSSSVTNTPIKSSNGTKSSTPRSANINSSVYDSLKKTHAKVIERAKRTPKTPASKNAAAWAKNAYPFSRSPRPPSAARRALDSVTVTPDGILIETPTPMRKRSYPSSTLSTPSKSHKRKDLGSEIPSPPSRNKPYRYPESWETASGEDILLFDMKNMDRSWKEITETFQSLTPHHYARTTLQNRYNKIKTRLGDMPKSLMTDAILDDAGSDLADIL